MKLATLLARLAKLTNTPNLASIVAGHEPLPEDCMVWTGRVTKPAYAWKKRSDPKTGAVYLSRGFNPSVIQIDYEGHRHYVHRLLHILMNKPTELFEAKNRCPNPRCVNPAHFNLQQAFRRGPVQQDLDDLPLDDAPWTLDEALDLLHRFRALYPGVTPDQTQDLLMDIPHALFIQATTGQLP